MHRSIFTTFVPAALLAAGLAACPGGEQPDAGVDGARPDASAVPDAASETGPVPDAEARMDAVPPDVSCPSGQSACASGSAASCVDLATDPLNCGACGTACTMGQSCVAGSCRCADGRVACGGRCVDTMTDPANCGMCGTACPAGQSCAAGRCACPAPLEACGAQCAALMTDATNCGMCGRACAPTESCSAGACSSLCGAGTTSCGGRCINPLTDAANCGACGNACGADRRCVSARCVPPNDARANAVAVTLMPGETTVTGHTGGATHDGPAVDCACTGGPDVWYRFVLAATELVYLDTAGSAFDTSLIIADAMGNPVPAQASNGSPGRGLCNDDAGCPVRAEGFTRSTESRTWGLLNAGTYYVVVGGCSTGAFTLHLQHLRVDAAANLRGFIRVGVGGITGDLPIRNTTTGTCGGSAMSTGEEYRIFATCGRAPQLFSVCASDGGTYERRQLLTDFDPVLYIRSLATGGEVACNDDGMTMGAIDCRGTGGDAMQYGARLNDIAVPRGLHAIFVDSRTGGDATFATMDYTLRYAVRNPP